MEIKRVKEAYHGTILLEMQRTGKKRKEWGVREDATSSVFAPQTAGASAGGECDRHRRPDRHHDEPAAHQVQLILKVTKHFTGLDRFYFCYFIKCDEFPPINFLLYLLFHKIWWVFPLIFYYIFCFIKCDEFSVFAAIHPFLCAVLNIECGFSKLPERPAYKTRSAAHYSMSINF